MLLQNCRSAIRSLLRSSANNHNRAALPNMARVKFLLANVVWLFPGHIAHVAFFQRPARAK